MDGRYDHLGCAKEFAVYSSFASHSMPLVRDDNDPLPPHLRGFAQDPRCVRMIVVEIIEMQVDPVLRDHVELEVHAVARNIRGRAAEIEARNDPHLRELRAVMRLGLSGVPGENADLVADGAIETEE